MKVHFLLTGNSVDIIDVKISSSLNKRRALKQCSSASGLNKTTRKGLFRTVPTDLFFLDRRV